MNDEMGKGGGNMQSHKRLLFVISRFLDGGIDTVLVEYLQYIVRAHDFEVTLAIGVRMYDLEVFLSRIPKEVKVIYFNQARWLVGGSMRRVTGDISSCSKALDEVLLNPIRRWNIWRGLKKQALVHDVVIDFACSYSSFMKSISKPKICFYHFSLPADLADNERRRLRMEGRLAYYDKIVAISLDMQRQFEKCFPALKPRMAMIYNAKNVERLQTKASEPSSAPIGKPYLLAIERLEESQKDITTLLHAMKILKEEYGFSMPLYLLGKGKSEDYLRKMAASLGVEEQVEFMGFTANPYPWLKNCTALLHSAKFEGLPTVLIEGLLLGKFIISTDCPTGPKEILDEGRAGILVPMKDARGFAEAVVKLMTDKGLQKLLLSGISSHQKAFTFESTYLQFVHLIGDVSPF